MRLKKTIKKLINKTEKKQQDNNVVKYDTTYSRQNVIKSF